MKRITKEKVNEIISMRDCDINKFITVEFIDLEDVSLLKQINKEYLAREVKETWTWVDIGSSGGLCQNIGNIEFKTAFKAIEYMLWNGYSVCQFETLKEIGEYYDI